MNILKSVSKFNVWDPCPGVPFDEITPLSRRCWSLLVRNKDGPTLQEGYSQIAGAIEMLSGLEYHHDNVVRISGMLAAEEMEDDTSVYHEAVAYVNRLGQIYYFAKSPLASRCVSDLSGAIPTILKYLPFRMKHSAHRSIDYPRGESEDTQLFQTTKTGSKGTSFVRAFPSAPSSTLNRIRNSATAYAAGMYKLETASRLCSKLGPSPNRKRAFCSLATSFMRSSISTDKWSSPVYLPGELKIRREPSGTISFSASVLLR